MKNLVSYSTLIITLFTFTSIYGQSSSSITEGIHYEDDWAIEDGWSNSNNRNSTISSNSARYRRQNYRDGISGLWAYEDAKSGEPFLFIIDGRKERIQLIPKDYDGDYLTLPVVRYFPKNINGQEYNEANFGKFRIRFPRQNRYDNEVNFSVTNKLRIFYRVTTADFSKSQLDQITDGSIYFNNDSDYTAEIYYRTREFDLFVGTIPAGFPHYQPTQKGMRWYVKANDWEVLTVIGSEGRYAAEDITNGSLPYAVRGTLYDDDTQDPQISRGGRGRNTEHLKQSIWISRESSYGKLDLLIFNQNASIVLGRKVQHSRSNVYHSASVHSYTNSHRVSFSGIGSLDLEFVKYGSNGYAHSRVNKDLLVALKQGNEVMSFERLDRDNSDDNMRVKNNMRSSVKLYYDAGNREVLFDILGAGRTAIIPSLDEMKWIVKSGNSEKVVSLSYGDRDIIVDDRFWDEKWINGQNPRIVNHKNIYAKSNKLVATNIMIGNSFGYRIRVFTENSKKELKPVGYLGAGDMDSFSSFVGQVWVAKSPNGTTVGRYLVNKEKDIVNFSSRMK